MVYYFSQAVVKAEQLEDIGGRTRKHFSIRYDSVSPESVMVGAVFNVLP